MRFLPALLCVFSLAVGTIAAPAEASADNALRARTDAPNSLAEANPLDKRDDLTVTIPAGVLFRRSAGLYWGPVNIGNLKLYLTNPHMGYAGPKFPDANHVNFHVDKSGPRNSWDSVVNLHIVKYSQGGEKECLYIWDSVTDTVVFDECFDHFTTAIEKSVEAVKNFVDTLLKNANFFASFVIIVAIGIALIACLSSLGAVAIA